MEPPSSSDATKDIKAIFDSFDLDKSGTIQLKQLGKVAEQLGQPIAAQQLASIVKLLDTNKDGKINFAQFDYWWTQGVTNKLTQLVILKAKALKMNNFIKGKFKSANISLKNHVGNVKPDKYSVKVNFGAEVPDSIKIGMSLYLKGVKQQQLLNKVKTLVPTIQQNAFGLILRLPSKNASESKASLDHLLNSIIKSQGFPVKITNLQNNPFVIAKTCVKDNDLIVQLYIQPDLQKAAAPTIQASSRIIEKLGDGFYFTFDVNFSLNSTFDKLLSEPIIQNILRGFNFSFEGQANNSALGKLRKFAQKQSQQMPALLQLITLFRCAKLNLKIKSPQHLQSFFKMLGIEDLVGGLPNLKDILQEMSQGIQQAKQTQPLFKIIHLISNYIFKNVQNNVQIFVLGGQMITGNIKLNGKGITKLHSVLFNQA